MGSGFIVAVIVGAGIAVQVAVLGRSTGTTGPLATSLGLQMSGVLVAAAWATSRGAWAEVATVSRNWWWIPLGAGGWIVVAALGFASSRIGVASTLALSVTTQLVAALGIDMATGANRLGPFPILGAALMISGALLVTAT